jgi:hypothetical protein
MKQSFFIDSTDGILKWIQLPPMVMIVGRYDHASEATYKQGIELAKKEAVIVNEPYIYQLLMHRYYPEFLDYSKTPYDNFLMVADKSRIYTIDMEEEIDVVEVPELPGFDHTSYPTFKKVARIKPKKVEEIDDDGWILSREKMPDVDGFYYVYAFVHEECGNIYPVHIIAECRINQWIKPDEGYQMTYWRPLINAPKTTSK